MSSRIDWDQLQGHRSSKGCLPAVSCTSNKTSSGEQTKAQIPPEGSDVEGTPYTTPRPNSASAAALWSSQAAPGPGEEGAEERGGGPRSPGHWPAQGKRHSGPASPRRRRQTRAQGSLFQDKVSRPFLPREVALQAHPPLPRPGRESPPSMPSRIPPPPNLPSQSLL